MESTLLGTVELFIIYTFFIPYRINVLPLKYDETVETPGLQFY